MAIEDYTAACDAIRATGLILLVARYEHEVMGHWLVEFSGAGGVARLAYDARDRTFALERATAWGGWKAEWVRKGTDAFTGALRDALAAV